MVAGDSLLAGAAARLVGRDRELSLITSHLRGERGSAVLVRGAAGVGKTTLVAAAVAAGERARVLSASCLASNSAARS